MDLELDATCGVDNSSMGGLDHYTIVQDYRHKTSSCVWKYFGHLKRNNELVDEKHVYCTKCFDESKTKKYQKSTSTGNLIKHLKKAHNVQDHPSYRIKQENDRIVVTKEETFFDDEGEVDYYLDNHTASYIPLNGIVNNSTKTGSSEADNNEFLVHDINEILIHEIAKRPQIYDSSQCTKNKAQIRRNLWTEIYEALNHFIAFDKLPKIWKNIRDRYQKIKKDMDKDGRTSKPRYRYYDMLRFLDDVDCSGIVDDKLTVPIDNFVSNFIFMEVEPQVETANSPDDDLHQPSSVAALQHHQPSGQPSVHLVDDIDDVCDIDEDPSDDEDDEDNDEDDEEDDDDLLGPDDDIHIDVVNGNLSHIHQVSMQDFNVVVKEEIFGHEPKAKKIKLDTMSPISLSVNDVDLDPNTSGVVHRDLMTPDNIASLLVEQHQHELLHQQQQQQQLQQQQQETLEQSPPSQSLPVTAWQLTPQHLADTLEAQQPDHLQQQQQQEELLAQATPPLLQHPQQQQLPTVTLTMAANSTSTTSLLHPQQSVINAQDVLAAATASIMTPPQQQQQLSVKSTPKCSHAGASEEFTIFGSYVAEVMKNMDKQRARLLQMKFMQLIAEYDLDDAEADGSFA